MTKYEVQCLKCNNTFDWEWGRSKGTCEHCKRNLTIKDVKLTKNAIIKYFN